MQSDDQDRDLEAFNVDDDDFDLLRALCLLIRLEEGDPDFSGVESSLDNLADEVRAGFAVDALWPERLVHLGKVLFAELKFQGDEDTYDDPRNSFIQCVLLRRRGLPITLSLLTCEVARRVGLSAFGIAFPGHFLVGVGGQEVEGGRELVVVDPFHQGRLWGPEHLQDHLNRVLGGQRELSGDDLRPASPEEILSRMLSNLRGSYARRQEYEHLLGVLSRLLILRPGQADLFLERAQVRHLLLDLDGALVDLDLAEERCQDPDKINQIRGQRSRWLDARGVIH